MEVAGMLHVTIACGKATISLDSRKVSAHFFEAKYKYVT